jgi:hypothetical protein
MSFVKHHKFSHPLEKELDNRAVFFVGSFYQWKSTVKMTQHCNCWESNETQLSANEGRVIIFQTAIFLSAANITLKVK